jgi:hypothetical protein
MMRRILTILMTTAQAMHMQTGGDNSNISSTDRSTDTSTNTEGNPSAGVSVTISDRIDNNKVNIDQLMGFSN